MKVSDLPMGPAPRALPLPHFPAPHLAVIWRNWQMVEPARLGRVLGCTPQQVNDAARSLGLSEYAGQAAVWRERGALTLIRRNWHLLNYKQLLELLAWAPEKLDFTLREDDFFWVKLGLLKPTAAPVRFRALSESEQARCAAIRREVEALRARLPEEGEEPFAFLASYGKAAVRPDRDGGKRGRGLRMIYSYAALYGDPLLEAHADPFPEPLLADYAASGVNAVWLPGVLYTLTPWLGENGFSSRCEERLDGLRRLVERAGKFGIEVFLYLNEPRAMPESAFVHHPEWRGAHQAGNDLYACCPAASGLAEALRDAVETVCRAVPALGGFFTITQSENLTHCLSRSEAELDRVCPRCADRTPADNIVAVLNAVHAGIAAAGGKQELIAWNWQWAPAWDADVLDRLPADIRILCVSENAVPTCSGGVEGSVNDYSISQVGPGEPARRLWHLARESGHGIAAKVQMNNSWELSTVPYIPVPQLVRRHIERLEACGVGDYLLSWTLGGWAGGNLELADCGVDEWILRRFPASELETVRAITAEFSRAFALFPFHQTSLIYNGPVNGGCANLLYGAPTGYASSMVGFAYDDLNTWCGDGHYPPEVLENAFREISEIWGAQLPRFAALADSPSKRELANLAEACYCHWRSAFCQIAFVRRRDAGQPEACAELLAEERELAFRLAAAQRRDSRIGFEASNQYAYVENDLLEKILNCRELEASFIPRAVPAAR